MSEESDEGSLHTLLPLHTPLPVLCEEADVQDIEEAMNQAFHFPPTSSVDTSQEKKPLDRLQAPELANVAGGLRVGNSCL